MHFEYARWEMGTASGLTAHCFRNGIAFIVAAQATRFRRELKPLEAFEIHSEVVRADERQMHILQLARTVGSEKVASGTMCRAVLRKGRDFVSPRELFETVTGAADGGVPLPQAQDVERTELAAMARLEEALA